MSAYNGNVQLVTIGLAAGIRMLAIAFFLVWCIWSFSTLYHDKGIAWRTGGLRSYRLNLNSAHTCVGKPPSVIVHYFPIYGASFSQYWPCHSFSKTWGTKKYVPFGFAVISFLPHSVCFSQQLHRTWDLVENFAASFCALNFIGSVRFVKNIYHILLLSSDII
jgi:hypothetical protein